MLCLIVGGGLLSAGARLSVEQLQSVPGLERLLARDTGTLYRAFPTALLFVAAQAALVIWWYRSRSVRDFDGRFRRWMKVAATCFLMSLCVGTELHLACGEFCSARLSATMWQSGVLSWLVPAGLLGLVVWLPLYRELRGNRLSIGFLLAATAMYLVAGAVRLRLVVLPTPELGWLALNGVAWLAHLLLGLCLVVHARYVMYFTAEPVERYPGEGRRDKGHFGWAIPTRWFRRAAASKGTETPKKEREPRRPVRAKSTPKARSSKAVSRSDEAATDDADRESSSERDDEVESSSPAVPVATIPSRPIPPANSPPTNSPQASSNVGKAPATPPPANRVIPVQAPPRAVAPAVSVETAGDSSEGPKNQERPRFEATQDDRDDEGADSEDDVNSDDGQSEMRGMSKKQRRKLMRESRDREQQSRRR